MHGFTIHDVKTITMGPEHKSTDPGFCFVEFTSESVAQKVMDIMNGMVIYSKAGRDHKLRVNRPSDLKRGNSKNGKGKGKGGAYPPQPTLSKPPCAKPSGGPPQPTLSMPPKFAPTPQQQPYEQASNSQGFGPNPTQEHHAQSSIHKAAAAAVQAAAQPITPAAPPPTFDAYQVGLDMTPQRVQHPMASVQSPGPSPNFVCSPVTPGLQFDFDANRNNMQQNTMLPTIPMDPNMMNCGGNMDPSGMMHQQSMMVDAMMSANVNANNNMMMDSAGMGNMPMMMHTLPDGSPSAMNQNMMHMDAHMNMMPMDGN